MNNLSKIFLIAFGCAVVVIAALVWTGFIETKGNHLEPTGHIGKVRDVKVDDNEVIAILDFNVQNNSDVAMVVRNIDAEMTAADGTAVSGYILAAGDIDKVFASYPVLGEKFNQPMKARDGVNAHERVDRMVGVRFDVPEDAFAKRRDVLLRIEDVTGPVVEVKSK
jgi:hypothetical protein